ncbi:helix-turn-helix domain-containing protein [Methylophaga sp. OBS4]|uniref:helix-turn-helix domain-containing protein n=1 Tax=Methylophaga sp. OBS4 TaxID=2991935 RepID=UPI00225237E5|nr:helix-turn-helix domain-containing protein [Methylophaga sp. OBS4]MCX4186746.1 XRE family transcriptional regulator [Methylophaga sp. OBS4]
MSVGDRVKHARESAKLTKAELARACSISKQAVGQIENGATKSPNPTTLFAIAKATKFNAEWIATGTGKERQIASGQGELAKARQEVREPSPTGTEHAQVNDDGVNRQNRLQIRSVPVLSNKEIIEGKKQDLPDRQYIAAQQVSDQAFAYPVKNIPNPNDRYGIDPDMYIVIDPDAEWENGKPLLLQDINQNLIIRRYEIVGSKRYLAPYNDKYDPIEMDDSFIVIGKIVSRHAVY